MYEIKLSSTAGKPLGVLLFPEKASEVTLKQFIRFEVAAANLEKWITENESKNPFDPNFAAGYIWRVFTCVNEFCGDGRIHQVPVGDYPKALNKFLGVKKISDIDLVGIEDSVMGLYANIWRTLATYKKHYDAGAGVDYSFEYKGVTYRLKKSHRDAITQQIRFESLTTAQAVEALEALRMYNHHVASDPKKAFYFTTLLHLVAILALADGEAFPTTDSEIDRWISDRVRYFEDIDMEAALNVADFFLSTGKALKETSGTNGFFDRLSLLLKDLTQRRSQSGELETAS